MTGTFDATAWTGLLLGATALFAGIGALRKPGAWRTMIEEVERSPALQFVCGMLELLIGALVYLSNPWIPSDLQFWLRTLAHMHRGWAASTALLGVVLMVPSLLRFQ